MIIPDSLLAIAVAIAGLSRLLSAPGMIGEYFIAGILASVFFLFLFFATLGRGMGLGDVKFAFLIGLVFGYRGTLISLYIAFLTGAVIGIILIITGKKKLHGSTIPFGPFLIIGMLGTWFFGNVIINAIPFLH